MSAYIYRPLLICMIVLPAMASAQEEVEVEVELQSITVAGQEFEYTDMFEDVQDIKSYYSDESLVLSVQDINGDGAADVWVVYREDFSIAKEMRDTDGDGTPDVFIDFSTDEKVTGMTGGGLKQFEVPELETGAGTSPGVTDTDYAGGLEDIEKLAGEAGGFSFWLFLLLILIGVGVWWKYKRIASKA